MGLTSAFLSSSYGVMPEKRPKRARMLRRGPGRAQLRGRSGRGLAVDDLRVAVVLRARRLTRASGRVLRGYGLAFVRRARHGLRLRMPLRHHDAERDDHLQRVLDRHVELDDLVPRHEENEA